MRRRLTITSTEKRSTVSTAQQTTTTKSFIWPLFKKFRYPDRRNWISGVYLRVHKLETVSKALIKTAPFPGLELFPDFITEKEETSILKQIDEFSENESSNSQSLKNRLVMHFGFAFEYGSNTIGKEKSRSNHFEIWPIQPWTWKWKKTVDLRNFVDFGHGNGYHGKPTMENDHFRFMNLVHFHGFHFHGHFHVHGWSGPKHRYEFSICIFFSVK